MQNPLIPILQSAKNSAITTKAVEMAQKLNEDAREWRRQGRPKQYIQTETQKRRTEMATALFDLVEREAEKLKAKTKADSVAWRDATERSLHSRAARLELARVKYEAMSVNELRTEINRVAGAEFVDVDPVEIDALFSTARMSDLDVVEIDAFRETIVEKEYQKPWLQSPEAKQRASEVALYQKQADRPYTIPAIMPDGTPARIDFSDLLDSEGDDNE